MIREVFLQNILCQRVWIMSGGGGAGTYPKNLLRYFFNLRKLFLFPEFIFKPLRKYTVKNKLKLAILKVF